MPRRHDRGPRRTLGAPGWTRRHRHLAMALALAAVVVLGAAGTVAAYYVTHSGPGAAQVSQAFEVELQPTAPGTYQVYLPIPAGKDGKAAPGFTLEVLEGAPRFGVVRTEHGLALSVRAEGPVKLRAEGPMPIRLSLDDVPSKHPQFRFWGFLGRDAAGPVLLKLEVREHTHTADWSKHTDVARSILLQLPLEPNGWQVVKATHLFDFAAGSGYSGGFPRVVIAAFGASVAGFYPPLGLLVLRWRRRDRAA